MKLNSKLMLDELFFVVEEGQANLGNYSKALSMIDAVADVGADAIEFQLARAKDFYVNYDPGYEIYLKREFVDAQIIGLIAYAKQKQLKFICTPLGHSLISILAKAGCDGININASDLTNPDIIDAVADSGIPFFLSLPLATEKEIEWAIDRIRKKSTSPSVILHGQHTMASGESGVAVEHTALGCISSLKKKYGLPVGFIDHTPHQWMPAAAVAAGAKVVTKHLTLSRAEKGPDWHICLEPKEMKIAIEACRKMWTSINITAKEVSPEEMLDRKIMRRSIVAAKVIRRGEIINRNDILFKRPGTGMDPSRFVEVVGKRADKDINPDEQVLPSYIKEA